MNEKVTYLPKTVETMTCGKCGNNTFMLCTDNVCHCAECHTLLLTIEWVCTDE
jgi:ribosomal protein S27AE